MGMIIKFFRSYLLCGLYLMYIYPRVAYINKHKGKYSLEYRYAYAQRKIKNVLRLLKVKIEVEGIEKIENEDHYLIVPNHRTLLDSLILITIVDKPIIFVAKSELRKTMFFGSLAYMIDTLFMERTNLRQSIEVIKLAKNKMNEGRIVSIFPEGTRNKTENKLLEFKPGAFKIAIETSNKIFPAVIKNSSEILGSKIKKNYKVVVEILKPITIEDYKDKTSLEITKQIFYMMEEKL